MSISSATAFRWGRCSSSRRRHITPAQAGPPGHRFDPGWPHMLLHFDGVDQARPGVGAGGHNSQDRFCQKDEPDSAEDRPARTRIDEQIAGSEHACRPPHHSPGVHSMLDGLQAHHDLQRSWGDRETLPMIGNEADPLPTRLARLPSPKRGHRHVERQHNLAELIQNLRRVDLNQN